MNIEDIKIIVKTLGGATFGQISVQATPDIIWSALVEPPNSERRCWTIRDVVDRGEGLNLEIAFDNFLYRSFQVNSGWPGFCVPMVEDVLPLLWEAKEHILETLEMEFLAHPTP